MTHRVGAKGQVVVPKLLRDRAGLRPGVEVDFEWVDGRIVLSPAVARPLGGRYAGSDLVSGLLEDRAAEPR